MAKKVQVPVVGGLRKTITIPDAGYVGTTIAGYAGQTLTLAQLKALLGVPATAGASSGGGSTPPASLNVGPGLSGGGVLVGAVPLNLTAPIPVFLHGGDDGGGGDGDAQPIPGERGLNGATGAQGPMGPAAYLTAEDGEDGWHAIPGNPGANGATGAAGPAGPASGLLYAADDPEDAPPPVVPSPLRTVNKGAQWVSGTAIVAASANVVYVNCPVAGTIRRVKVMTSGGPGNCVLDVWKAPFGSFPPTVANSIVESAPPTIVGGTTYDNAALTGWTRSIAAGDVLAFKITSCATFTQITVVLEIDQWL